MADVYVRSGAAGTGTGASWANAYTTLAAALAAKAAGDNFWVSEDHAETQASAMTLTSPGTATNPCYVYCADHAGSVPPVAADLRTTATITTTGANAMTLPDYTYCEGITFNCGSGAVNSAITFSTFWSHFKNCQIAKNGTTGNTSCMVMGSNNTTAAPLTILENTTLKFGATGDAIRSLGGLLIWKNTPSAIAGSAFPTNLFGSASGVASRYMIEGVDLSALGSGKMLFAAQSAPRLALLKDCKLNASVTIQSTSSIPAGQEIILSRSDSAGTNYIERKYTFSGSQVDELVVVRTGGASDGTTLKSRLLSTTANSRWVMPFEAIPIAVWNATAGSSVTVTIKGVMNAAALPNNDDIWFDVEYLGSGSSPLGSFATGSKAENISTGSAWTASTRAWDSMATARANSHTYAQGDVLKVASNADRIFFCTTGGASAGSEPGGYASAVDGGSVTDGAATFRAGMRFSMAVSFTPQQAGFVYVYLKAAKASTSFYIDPLAVLS